MRKLSAWFNGKLSIRGKFILCFAVLVSIPIIILGAYSYTRSKEDIEAQCIATVESNLSSAVTELDARFAREATYIKYLAYNLKFRRLLEQSPVDRVQLAMELNNSVEPILWYYITSDDYVKGIEIYAPSLATGLGSFLKPVAECVGEPWYTRHSTELASVWTYQNGELFVSRSILDASTVSRVVGVMRVNLFPATFFQSLAVMRYLDNGIILTDESGHTVYERKSGHAAADEAAHALLAGGKGNDVILRQATIPSTGWTLTYYVDTEMITGQLTGILRSTLLIVGAVLILAVVIISLMSRTQSRRVLLLRDCAERVAAGDLDTVVETEDTDEIGVVINSFASMTKRLNQTINEVYKIQLEKKAVELRALQAQINPHFLYNALSTINWKAIRNGDTDISEVTGLLASFYRTSLNNGEPLTTVKNELDNVRAYVELQQHMHSFSFDVEYRIDETALPLTMLNFLLQPIVENAVKHGIDYAEDADRPPCIIVECALEDEHLVFRVRNSGPAVEAAAILASLSRPGKGYGIYNIQERIKLYYGEGCGVSAFVDGDGYSCFTVRILSACP